MSTAYRGIQDTRSRRAEDGGYLEIARSIYPEEYGQALQLAQELGLRLDAHAQQRHGRRARGPLPTFAMIACMDEYYVWMTTRRIEPGTRHDFERAWRPPQIPAGMVRAYELWSEDGEEIVGVSVWESRDGCERYRASDAEQRRRAAMAPFVLEESSSTYMGRELALPGR